MESLILFVNDEVSEFICLPMEVTDRVVIGDTFATRDIMRSLYLNSQYYVLVLSQQNARLIQAFNDKVVKEIGAPFPIENKHYHPNTKREAVIGNRQTSLIAEYFNQIDKEVNKIRKDTGLPVLICTDESNFNEYMKIADQKNTIFQMYLGGIRLEEKDHAIIKDAWKIIKDYVVKRNNDRKAELEKAVGTGKFLSDMNDIWRGIKEGRVQTVFVEQGMFKPALINNDSIEIVSEDQRNTENYVDDVIDEMLELYMSFGGESVFLPKGELSKFNGYGAITRY